MSSGNSLEGIAVVGYAGRFPRAANITRYWENLAAGRDCFTEFTIDDIVREGVPRETAERSNYVRRAPVIENPGHFDARLFKYSPKEAELIDPQQRILLECAWEAFENAGYDPHCFAGQIGVWAGVGVNNYFLKNILSRGSFETTVGFQEIINNDKDYLASRIAFKLGLRGPAVVVQTACSTSLVAVNMACLGLLTYQCDMAVAGAVFLQTPRARGYLFHEGEIFSPDGYCRAFDKGANGTVLGEGCGLVVLRRLEDAVADGDSILAVIRGSAVNNDGAARAGYTAPGVAGQIELLTMAQAVAGVEPEELSYIEAHGTGTQLGDPIEIAALTQVFRRTTKERGFCGIGSVKTNIGHLDVAAGIAGLIKTICALQHRKLPPTINFREANPELKLSESPFYVVDKLMDWQPRSGRRIAGVSSFGMGGTNAHVILEEYVDQRSAGPSSRLWHLFPLSAATPTALNALEVNLSEHLKEKPEISFQDAAWTLAVGRTPLRYRRCVVADSHGNAAARLAEQNALFGIYGEGDQNVHPLIFMCSGQGTQYSSMGAELYRSEPVFRENMDKCSRLLGAIHDNKSLIDILYGSNPITGEVMNQTALSQPALFAFEYSMIRLLDAYGIKPAAIIGHSIGEYPAACEAGIFSLKDALHLVKERGRLMQSMNPGAMIAIPRSESDIRKLLPSGLDLAVVNGPSITVVSGPVKEIEDFEKYLETQGIKFRKLQTSHGYHSRAMEPAARAFAEIVRGVTANPPQIPLASNLTGTWMTDEQAVNPEYWANHLRNTVRFCDNLGAVVERFNAPILLEVGPGNTLGSIAKQNGDAVAALPAISTARHPLQRVADHAFFLRALGGIWCHGGGFDPKTLYAAEKRVRIPLPSYPFEGQFLWIGADLGARNETEQDKSPHRWFDVPGTLLKRVIPGRKDSSSHRELTEDELARIWSKTLGVPNIGVNDNFFELGGHSLLAVSIITELEKSFGIRLPLATLIEAPTIREFFRLLERRESGKASPYLVSLNAKGSKTPFFLMHSHGGNILEYHPLANLLKEDRPIYAIQCRGLDGSPVEDMSVEEMAAVYLKEIRTVQPKGPYYIGGFCFGGYLSLEIAHLLRAENEEVELLVLINSATHLFNTYDPNISRIGHILCSLRDRMALEWDELAGQPLEKKYQRLAMRFERIIDLFRNKAEIILDRFPEGSPFHVRKHSLVYHLEKIAAANDRAWGLYRPKPYDGKVLFLRARKQPLDLVPDPMLGWTGILTGKLHVHEVPGFRQNMLDEPNVPEVAKLILKHLP